ncbi:endonuclease NucS domain-containing protein [Chishuiella sp.]|uniref:endonuclease NucS domain-containing protein n=1 Tax=Chishuiella sp. TaxID=1969467 RepID=UPI0028A9F254|nr:endonuclease NucS domain-containing protein [Chishuiella sp.]
MKKLLYNLEEFKLDIDLTLDKKGAKRIGYKRLLKIFGYSNNVKEAREKIKIFFDTNNLYFSPIPTENLSKEEKICITNHIINKTKDDFESERELENFIIKHKLLKKIGIKEFDNQKLLRGTEDKVDYIGKDKENNTIIVELKKSKNSIGIIEQLLRYKGILLENNIEKNSSKIKMYLITGEENLKIKYAFKGLLGSQRKHFKWFVYKYDKSIKDINEQLKFHQIEI